MAGRTRTVNGKVYTISAAHEAADLLPWVSDDELQALADDIRQNGQKSPIIRHRGVIVDGRHREVAALIAGVQPKYQDIPASTPQERIIAGILSANLHRRHLTTSQRAIIAAELTARMQGQSAPVPMTVERVSSAPVPTQAEAASALNVSVRSVGNATRVLRDAPDLADLVKNGTLDVTTAARIAEYPEAVRAQVAGAEDPKAVADELLTDLEDPPEPMDDTLPEPSHDASPRPLPKGWTPGNKVDPDHPFANLLHKFSSLSAEITKAFKTDIGKELLWTLGDMAKRTVKLRFVAFSSDDSGAKDGNSVRSTTGKFVGFYALRQLVKLVGKKGKRLTEKQIQKTLAEIIAASEDDILDAEGWK